MEVDAVLEMFRRSLENLGVRFLYYVSGGDSKTYTGIIKAAPYGKTEVTKEECVCHVQKRIGTRLRACRKKHGLKNCCKDALEDSHRTVTKVSTKSFGRSCRKRYLRALLPSA